MLIYAKLFTFMSALAALFFVCELGAQTRRQTDYVATLSREEAQERWTEFSKDAALADYIMRFKLTHLPRKGKEYAKSGTILGAKRGDKTYTRIIFDSDNNAPPIEFLLINSQKQSEVWRWNGKLEKLEKTEWTKPFIDGFVYAPFDILIPYRHWNCAYAGGGRISQAVHYFDCTSDDFKGKVRIALSREFNHPVQTQIFDEMQKPLKTLSLGSVKKFDEVWLMREADLRDELSRDKDKLLFERGKVRANHKESIFKPDSLGNSIDMPELKKL